MIARCLFEQSGTFKNEFKKLGIEAYDYYILNDYGQTDFVIDLFEEIEKAYDGGCSIFDEFKQDDIILAFFPCIRFECKVPLLFRGESPQQKNWSDEKKLQYSMRLHEELHENYMVFSKMVLVALKRGLKLIIENPLTQPHYLTSFFPIKPALKDKNRRLDGDYMEKPTQYWFIGLNPKENILFEPIEFVEKRIHDKMTGYAGISRQKMRSEIHQQYANRFIRKYILNENGEV